MRMSWFLTRIELLCDCSNESQIRLHLNKLAHDTTTCLKRSKNVAICSTFGVSSSSSILITSSSIVAATQRLCFFREYVGISQKISGTKRCSLCCSQPLQLLQRCFMKTQESENLRKLARLDKTERMSSQGDIGLHGWSQNSMLYLHNDLITTIPRGPTLRSALQQGKDAGDESHKDRSSCGSCRHLKLSPSLLSSS